MFDYSLLHYAKEHYELRLKSAERGAWEHELLKDVPDWVDRALARLGAKLVNTGRRLQQREAAEMGRA
jgi:hypothetical protein